MFARLKLIKPYPVLAFVPGLMSDTPHNEIQKPKPETAYERVIAIFKLDEFKSPSKELITAYNTGLMGGVIGGSIAGLKAMQIKYSDFVTKLNSTMFQTQTEAKQELTKLLAATFTKACFSWGIRIAFFTTMYTLTTNVLAAYNEKVSVWNFTISGLITGVIYRIPLGLRAMIVAGTLGGFLGTFAGVCSVFLLYQFNMKYDDIQQWHYDARSMRYQKIQDARDITDREKYVKPIVESREQNLKTSDLKDL